MAERKYTELFEDIEDDFNLPCKGGIQEQYKAKQIAHNLGKQRSYNSTKQPKTITLADHIPVKTKVYLSLHTDNGLAKKDKQQGRKKQD